MPDYRQFCPVAKGAEVFAERWTPLILRELLCGSHRFSELQRGIPQISQSTLTQRLRFLEREGVIERRRASGGHGWEYFLTPAGEEFGQVLELLGGWGYRWALDHLSADDVDPASVMWFIHRYINVERLPERRVVVRVELREPHRSTWWLILNRPEVELCLRDEGFEVDLLVTADALALTQVLLGHLSLREAIRQRKVEVDGPRDLACGFVGWIGTSQFVRFGHPTDTAQFRAPGVTWPALGARGRR